MAIWSSSLGTNLGNIIVSKSFWNGKRVFVSGHTGFKGAWLSLWLEQLGANISGFALPPSANRTLFSELSENLEIEKDAFGDVRDLGAIRDRVSAADPEIVFHLAAQPLVLEGFRNPIDTFSTNVMGTANLLESLRHSPNLKVVVIVTTDKVYRSSAGEERIFYTEDASLGGSDPYSASKSAAEIVSSSFSESFFRQRGVRVSTARAGNVIGGGDWSDHRLVPDLVRAWKYKTKLKIRNKNATRPWQHVLEPLRGYLALAESLFSHGGLSSAFNFGPNKEEHQSVERIVHEATKLFPTELEVEYADSIDYVETTDLALDNSLAGRELGIWPIWSTQQALEKTINWYVRFDAGVPARSLCEEDILSFRTAIEYETANQ